MTRTNELKYTSVEICAGAGGQAVGLHNAGFKHAALIEIDKHACQTLRNNTEQNPEWAGCKVIEADLTGFDSADLGLEPGELDLLAGGVPCPPFSAAGKQLGRDDERDLFPEMLRLVHELEPKAVMIENVRGLIDPKFAEYRQEIIKSLESMGYEECYWEVLEAKAYGVPQLRPRAILVAMKPEYAQHIQHTKPEARDELTVGAALHDSMRARYDAVADDPRAEQVFNDWHKNALQGVAPTVVGGSKKHGGADLGPTRAKLAWADLGVCGLGVANEVDVMLEKETRERDLFAVLPTPKLKRGTQPDPEGESKLGPMLTVSQAAIIQGFPEGWKFSGGKTAAYRQVGNAFPPPVAQAVGEQIYAAFKSAEKDAR